MRRSLPLISALTITLTAPASHATNGVGAGHGACWPLATPTERALMLNESRGHTTADNPTSTAFGCGQLLLDNRRRFAKVCRTRPDTMNPHDQMCMLRAYVASRHGTAAKALQFRRARGWF